ncbi:leucine-rich repeat-containing protein kinase family protein [Rheinheimera sp. 1928-s]|uniref:leucine-rich repeat-containing protein kinase family protein n=1 Tax=Rheinheimera sp. 1928-s TaxID=3033803 RepID=UPI0026297D95|nr:leucine-rich repeat-containing protein kinase family protein [Rheinheimera sp. 1928-s]MDF3124631.1 leucine-rich repeat-containing protein kinase family protein [Rheinheimera sp. 1928-s]
MFSLETLAQTKAPLSRINLAAGLREFPADLYRFADSVEILDLSGNQLSDLPADFHRFTKLKRLFLTNNNFDQIPAVLSLCPALVMVSFKGNQLTDFAEGSLPEQLEWLILTDNQLTQLPNDFGRYTKLRKVAMAGNQLSSLPDSMQQCRELGLLRLSLNKFESFPDWLFELPKLAWLALGANPACPVPEAQASTAHSLSDYQLLEKLGEGASGVIYQACFAQDKELVALKQFKGWVTSDGCPKDEMNNYLNAGEHPNLIAVKAKLKDCDLPGLVMELVPASFSVLGQPPSFETCTRDTFTQGQSLTLAELKLLAQQVVDVMAHLHQQQIVHGDLYAHNMLVNATQQLYLGDFGAATALNALPPHQQQHFCALEVRAFGYWLLDMQTLLSVADAAEFENKWAAVFNLCLQQEVKSRQGFRQLKALLQAL